ncbi:hypothetical protein ACSBR1_021401 [Camellia fascicularis]
MDAEKANSSMEMVELRKEGEEDEFEICVDEKEKTRGNVIVMLIYNLPIYNLTDTVNAATAESTRARHLIPKQIHCFYFIKFRSYEEMNLNFRFEDQARARITKDLQQKKLERDHIISELKHGPCKNSIERLACKRSALKHYEGALDQILPSHSKITSEGKRPKEKRLHSTLQHGSKSLAEEKKILRDIKQMEAAIEDDALKPQIPHYLGSKEDIQNYIQCIHNEIDGLQKEHLAFLANVKLLKRKLEVAEKYIVFLERKLADIIRIQDAAFKCILQLRKDEMNALFNQYLSLLKKAEKLRRNKDVAVLKELSNTQVEKFMSQWNNNKAFRDDHAKTILPIASHEAKAIEFWHTIKAFRD